MKALLFTLTLAWLSSALIAQKKCAPYLDQDGNECVLTWNMESGKSKLLYYDLAEKKYVEAKHQLGTRPSSDRGKFGMRIFLDQNGTESILTWNTETGHSRLYYHEETMNKFVMTYYQLPSKPIEGNGHYEFVPYQGKDGIESILVWNLTTGDSKHYVYSESKNDFIESEYQLPKNPAGDHGLFNFAPFIDKDGEESFVVWNKMTGISKIYHFDSKENKYIVSPYQLPQEKIIKTRGGYGITPYLDKAGEVCLLTWNSKTGASLLYYFDSHYKKYMTCPYQLPAKPTGDEGAYEFMAYVDRYGAECVLTWNTVTGVSKLYRHVEHENAFTLSGHQLLIMH